MPIRDFEAQRFRVVLGACLLFGFAGCQSREVEFTPQPRPVTVTQMTLKSDPEAILVSASVGSWKQEQIGFEIDGRIIRVIEPSKDIEGRIVDAEGNLLAPGTKIAGIDPERYNLLVRRAVADVEQFTQRIKAAEIELKEDLQFRKRAANAELKLALAEYDRTEGLFNRQAASKSELDKAETQLASARAAVDQLIAAEGAKQAELDSLKAQRAQAMESQRDAERNLENCTLYSSFDGQVAEVNVVPGSVVSPGQPVATVQMMNPIKVEFEVSADDSVLLQARERLPVRQTRPDGTTETWEGYVYQVDPFADVATRTFTVTLLVLNKKRSAAVTDDPQVGRTEQLWQLSFDFIPGMKPGELYAPEQAIRHDAEGAFVWKVTNTGVDRPMPRDRRFAVVKQRIRKGEKLVPFLGNWIFRQVYLDDETFNPKVDLIVGEISNPDLEPDAWNGDTVIIDDGGQWKLRPGDVVQVDLTSLDAKPGYFVPMNAVVHADGHTYVFIANGSESIGNVKKFEVVVSAPSTDATSSSRRVELANGDPLEGSHVVTRGAHYLVDGEPVRIAEVENQE